MENFNFFVPFFTVLFSFLAMNFACGGEAPRGTGEAMFSAAEDGGEVEADVHYRKLLIRAEVELPVTFAFFAHAVRDGNLDFQRTWEVSYEPSPPVVSGNWVVEAPPEVTAVWWQVLVDGDPEAFETKTSRVQVQLLDLETHKATYCRLEREEDWAYLVLLKDCTLVP